MSKTCIETTEAPAPIGPYSQAVSVGNLIFISGQIALVPESGKLNMSNIQDETHQVMHNIRALLKAAEVDFVNVVKTTIFLSDMAYFGAVNEVYGKYFQGNFPARETVAVVGLPKNVNVEISVIAAK